MKTASTALVLIAMLTILAAPASASAGASAMAVTSSVVADGVEKHDGGATVDGYEEDCD